MVVDTQAISASLKYFHKSLEKVIVKNHNIENLITDTLEKKPPKNDNPFLDYLRDVSSPSILQKAIKEVRKGASRPDYALQLTIKDLAIDLERQERSDRLAYMLERLKANDVEEYRVVVISSAEHLLRKDRGILFDILLPTASEKEVSALVEMIPWLPQTGRTERFLKLIPKASDEAKKKMTFMLSWIKEEDRLHCHEALLDGSSAEVKDGAGLMLHAIPQKHLFRAWIPLREHTFYTDTHIMANRSNTTASPVQFLTLVEANLDLNSKYSRNTLLPKETN